MMVRGTIGLLALLLVASLGCDSAPGKPRRSDAYVRPSEVVDFEALYSMHCSGCHGAAGVEGGAYPLANPDYLAWAPRADVRRAVAVGVPGTSMPAFSQAQGGWLTDAQIDAVVDGLYDRWAPSKTPDDLPPYHSAPAESVANVATYRRFCGECHGRDGTGTDMGSDIVAPAYLALVSDQGLRTAVVAGRPDIGMPGFRKAGPQPLTPEQIDEVVGWLAAQRPAL